MLLKYSQLINVRVKDPINKANAGALIRVLIRQLNVDFPVSTSEWRYEVLVECNHVSRRVGNILSSGPLKRT